MQPCRPPAKARRRTTILKEELRRDLDHLVVVNNDYRPIKKTVIKNYLGP